ncbi:ABC transporter ATP-binding protein [Aquibacillus koreensis]|uniref:ABC transporter ATP-binding protein n=1 Tax=Aquibacillus koreensis TaxID=279446 RepID=A0A9X3WIR5_9BACI|nr:ABC transporter ATP-binding protein [Aquibacillus koreensis]MCT2534208.1 ABC transporter ATP-binding protein [Aquibacillus koreensis]MDC3420747.1 ABC transporter ATP-binding protein [Aquibacillus koreensis]
MIEIINLTKKYGSFTALNNLNLTIEKGSVFGFVGPNGAGKTTTFSILATLLAPTSGTAYVNGYDVTKDPKQVRKHIGYMPDFFGVYDQFKVHEYLDFYGASYGVPSKERQAIIPQLLELVNLTDKKDSYVDLLSRGMKQRLCLARSLIHDPEVLILDEPASGLDPRARIEMRGILQELKNMEKTIIISSHILPELSEMCDYLGIIEHGNLIASGNVNQIQSQLQANKILFVSVKQDIDNAIAFFENDLNVQLVERDDKDEQLLHVSYEGSDDDQVQLLKKAITKDIPILTFSQKQSNLEDIFMEITKGEE